MIHVGTDTTSGRVIAIAVKTDVLTEMGKIVTVLEEAKPEGSIIAKRHKQIKPLTGFCFSRGYRMVNGKTVT